MSTTVSYYNPKTGQYDSPTQDVGMTTDPWGMSGGRGEAVNALKPQVPLSADPSNIYRSKLQQMMTGQFSPSDPSYQWRFQQGQQAVERSLAAKGLLGSGNAAIELQQYGQGAASTEYQAQFQRLIQGMTGVEAQYGSQMDRLMKLAGVEMPSAGAQIGIEQQRVNLAGQGQRWGQDYQANQDRGIGDALSKLQQQSFGNLTADYTAQSTYEDPAPEEEYYYYTPSYTPSPIYDTQTDTMVRPGSGYVSSSGGDVVGFGDYASKTNV